MINVSCLTQAAVLRRLVPILFLGLWLAACGGSGEAEIDTEATVAAAVAATQAAEPTATSVPPTDTPIPPTETPTPLPPTDTPTPVPPTDTPTPTPEAVELPTSYSLYVDPDGHFELSLPDGWELDPDEASILAISPDDRALVGVLGVPGEAVLNDEDLEKQGEDFLTAFVDDADTALNITASQLEADGSISFEFETQSDTRDAVGILYVEQRGLDTFYLILSSDVEVWDDYSDILLGEVLSTYFVTPENVTTFLSPPLELVSHSEESGLFTVGLPVDWEVSSEPGAVGAVAPNDGSRAIAISIPVDFTLADAEAEIYAESFLTEIYSGAPFTIESIEPDTDGSYGITYSVEEDNKTVFGYIYLLQLDQQLYHLVFQSELSDWFGMLDTYGNVLDSYGLTPPEPVALPTPTSVPAQPTPQVDSFAPQPGRSRLYVFNEVGEELTFTINNQEHKIPPYNIDTPVEIDFDPGKYTYTVSIPNGSVNGEVEMGPNESWAIGVRGDYQVYNPFIVYPE
jgi:hypothetical protein